MIRHTVAFNLKHERGSVEEKNFLSEALALARIPSVKSFEQLRQISAKNGFSLGFSMEFDDQAGYDAYNEHPTHTAFVRDRWQVEVSDFLEADFVKI